MEPEARFCWQCGEPREGAAPDADGKPVADPLIGRVVENRYRIVSLIARGGMGVVYKVEHVHIGKVMAMKLLHGELSGKRDVIQRFRREAEAASHLSHPNTVQIFDFGSDGGLMYLVMEYLDGDDLGVIVRRDGTVPFTRLARIGVQLAGSVGEAHAKGIVHRDLKPENIMVLSGADGRDVIKVLDFGLAKLRTQKVSSASLTNAGALLGTPYYMAPEQIRGDAVDERSDIYSVGATFYKVLTGTPPFVAQTPMGVLTKHLTASLRPPSRRLEGDEPDGVPEMADRIVLKAMAREPADRYQSMDELRADLREYLASVGEVERDASDSNIGSSGARLRAPEVATRGDVDRYERTIKRRSWLGIGLLLMLVLGLASVGAYAFRSINPDEFTTHEREPNNTLATATPLLERVPLRGMLGKRVDATAGDSDIYRIDIPPGGGKFIQFSVSRIPNMDLALDLAKAGSSDPVLVVNAGGVGVEERVPSFPVHGSTYYLRVREHVRVGGLPMENVSDEYKVEWSFAEPRMDEERELNDSLELAGKVSVGKPVTGHIGWDRDVDTYCLDGAGGNLHVTVGAVPDVDLRLRVVDTALSKSVTVNEHGLGEGESADVANAAPGTTCFELSAASETSRAPANPRVPYTLTLE